MQSPQGASVPLGFQDTEAPRMAGTDGRESGGGVKSEVAGLHCGGPWGLQGGLHLFSSETEPQNSSEQGGT